MSLHIAIAGLPNVGKSTLFNALTQTSGACVANYPFCTIDPNVGVVSVPDARVQKLAEIVKPQRVLDATVEFVDIAGLIKGASQGEGLGNQFLGNIRECEAIAEVVRVFEDADVVHIAGGANPHEDIAVLETELCLADLETVERRLQKARLKKKNGDKKAAEECERLELVRGKLAEGVKFCNMNMKEEFADLQLLTAKPILYVFNVDEKELAKTDTEALRKKFALPIDAPVCAISAKIEAELAALTPEEVKSFLQDLGLQESGLHKLIRLAYQTLGLQTFFTAGPKEVRAWTVRKGAKAPEAAGKIHSDFEKGFISAEVVAYDDFVAENGEICARAKGKLRIEGKNYIVRDGDVMHFRFSP